MHPSLAPTKKQCKNSAITRRAHNDIMLTFSGDISVRFDICLDKMLYIQRTFYDVFTRHTFATHICIGTFLSKLHVHVYYKGVFLPYMLWFIISFRSVLNFLLSDLDL